MKSGGSPALTVAFWSLVITVREDCFYTLLYIGCNALITLALEVLVDS